MAFAHTSMYFLENSCTLVADLAFSSAADSTAAVQSDKYASFRLITPTWHAFYLKQVGRELELHMSETYYVLAKPTCHGMRQMRRSDS